MVEFIIVLACIAAILYFIVSKIIGVWSSRGRSTQ
jgi:hypothetical protein